MNTWFDEYIQHIFVCSLVTARHLNWLPWGNWFGNNVSNEIEKNKFGNSIATRNDAFLFIERIFFLCERRKKNIHTQEMCARFVSYFDYTHPHLCFRSLSCSWMYGIKLTDFWNFFLRICYFYMKNKGNQRTHRVVLMTFLHSNNRTVFRQLFTFPNSTHELDLGEMNPFLMQFKAHTVEIVNLIFVFSFRCAKQTFVRARCVECWWRRLHWPVTENTIICAKKPAGDGSKVSR